MPPLTDGPGRGWGRPQGRSGVIRDEVGLAGAVPSGVHVLFRRCAFSSHRVEVGRGAAFKLTQSLQSGSCSILWIRHGDGPFGVVDVCAVGYGTPFRRVIVSSPSETGTFLSPDLRPGHWPASSATWPEGPGETPV